MNILMHTWKWLLIWTQRHDEIRCGLFINNYQGGKIRYVHSKYARIRRVRTCPVDKLATIFNATSGQACTIIHTLKTFDKRSTQYIFFWSQVKFQLTDIHSSRIGHESRSAHKFTTTNKISRTLEDIARSSIRHEQVIPYGVQSQGWRDIHQCISPPSPSSGTSHHYWSDSRNIRIIPQMKYVYVCGTIRN